MIQNVNSQEHNFTHIAKPLEWTSSPAESLIPKTQEVLLGTDINFQAPKTNHQKPNTKNITHEPENKLPKTRILGKLPNATNLTQKA